MARDRLKEAQEKLGPRLQEAVQRLRDGQSKQQVGKILGINPRWLSDLNPMLQGDDAPPPKEVDPKVLKAAGGAEGITAARGLIEAGMPLQTRIRHWIKLSKSKDERVSASALERLDALMGVVPSKIAVDPDPPPLFKLPDHSMPTLQRYDDWIKLKGTEMDAVTTPVPPAKVH